MLDLFDFYALSLEDSSTCYARANISIAAIDDLLFSIAAIKLNDQLKCLQSILQNESVAVHVLHV